VLYKNNHKSIQHAHAYTIPFSNKFNFFVTVFETIPNSLVDKELRDIEKVRETDTRQFLYIVQTIWSID